MQYDNRLHGIHWIKHNRLFTEAELQVNFVNSKYLEKPYITKYVVWKIVKSDNYMALFVSLWAIIYL